MGVNLLGIIRTDEATAACCEQIDVQRNVRWKGEQVGSISSERDSYRTQMFLVGDVGVRNVHSHHFFR
ncbi:hypothetical protein DYQ48_19780 [Xanthomonas hortorum]|nr:hypothetical protein BI317_22855 [Xanthomonas hortorum pv. gardneri]ASW46768.1 hypothetical protein XJ27_12920 [Xanthomonas hortorum]PPU48577.1 hypothetical protein XcyCFBP4188_05310 [Xanthomonas hortorum pv. cynarae]QEW16868.1 hypothetical protein DYQ48_19780 [Xanthomonas hortorum]